MIADDAGDAATLSAAGPLVGRALRVTGEYGGPLAAFAFVDDVHWLAAGGHGLGVWENAAKA